MTYGRILRQNTYVLLKYSTTSDVKQINNKRYILCKVLNRVRGNKHVCLTVLDITNSRFFLGVLMAKICFNCIRRPVTCCKPMNVLFVRQNPSYMTSSIGQSGSFFDGIHNTAIKCLRLLDSTFKTVPSNCPVIKLRCTRVVFFWGHKNRNVINSQNYFK